MDAGRCVLAMAFASAVAASCGNSAGTDAGLRIERGVEVADVTVTDIYAPLDPPGDASRYPLVVMLHGGDGDPDDMASLAEAVARRGAVVHVPTWPVVSERLEGELLDLAYHRQVEAVVCALRHARRTAVEHGADGEDLTLLGHSAGGFVGAAVALVDEPPWPGIDCDVGVEHRPQRFIGTSGDYTGSSLYAVDEPEVAAAYDPAAIRVTNDDLEVRLIHGFADDTIWADAAFELRNRLDDLGLDAAMLALDVDHGGPIEPSGALDFVAGQIAALLAQEPTAFEPGQTARFSFDSDRCVYDGPQEWTIGEAVAIDLHNGSDVRVFFSFVAVDDWQPSDAGLEFDGQPWIRIDEWQVVPMAATYLPLGPADDGELSWAFVDGSLPWMLWCVPVDDHPAKGVLHPAGQLVPRTRTSGD